LQTIKTIMDGKALYRKPTKAEGGYKAKKSYKNMWYFHNRSELICKQIWFIGQAYYERMQEPKNRPTHRIKNPVQLIKLFYWIYLTGARNQEAFKKPYPTLDIVNKEGETRVIITHVNSKHKGPNNTADTVTEMIPILDEWEQKMWNFSTDGNQESQAAKIFGYGAWKSYRKNNITSLFIKNFRTALESPEKEVFKNEGIRPHILRHMRTYNLLSDHRVPRDLAQLWMGWDSQYMLDYYAHIRQVMDSSKQLDILREKNLLTNLKVEGSKLFS